MHPRHSSPIKIGVSSCLLGNQVRFDGGHKRNDFLVETFGQFVEWVPVCPEIEIGLGVPRRTLRLIRSNGETRLADNPSKRAEDNEPVDHTSAMRSYAGARAKALADQKLCGYVLKKDSPSCGMERVRVYGPGAMPSRDGRGLFADALISEYPNLPVEEEGRLADPRLRENFVERVFAYRDLRTFFDSPWKSGGLVAFHTARKLQLMAHSRVRYERLGQMVANAKQIPRKLLRGNYENEFMAALRELATRARHKNVLDHIAGHLRHHLEDESRQELQTLIADYRNGLVPLIVPITLIRHHVRRCDVSYLSGQSYLEPHPKELMLRNHV